MSFVGLGNPVPAAPEPEYHDVAAAAVVHDHETIVTHVHDVNTAPADFTVVETLDVGENIIAPEADITLLGPTRLSAPPRTLEAPAKLPPSKWKRVAKLAPPRWRSVARCPEAAGTSTL